MKDRPIAKRIQTGNQKSASCTTRTYSNSAFFGAKQQSEPLNNITFPWSVNITRLKVTNSSNLARVSLSSQQREGRPCLSVISVCLALWPHGKTQGWKRADSLTNGEDDGSQRGTPLLPSRPLLKASHFYHMTVITIRSQRHHRNREKKNWQGDKFADSQGNYAPVLQARSFEREANQRREERDVSPFLDRFGSLWVQAAKMYVGWEPAQAHCLAALSLCITLENKQHDMIDLYRSDCVQSTFRNTIRQFMAFKRAFMICSVCLITDNTPSL